MTSSPAILIINAYCDTHQHILAFLQKLSTNQLHWRLNSDSHSIAYHTWHNGRWAD